MSDAFTFSADHLALLQLQRVVTGTEPDDPLRLLDPDRPYGSLDVARDVATALGWTFDPDLGPDEAQATAALELHAETQTALDVFLDVGTAAPGDYGRGGEGDPWETTA